MLKKILYAFNIIALPLFFGMRAEYGPTPLLLHEWTDLAETSRAKQDDYDAHPQLLILAVNNNDLNQVQQLINQKVVNIDEQDALGETALYKSITNRNEAIANFLMINSADANIINNNGYPPLYQAARNGNNSMIPILTQKGPNIKTAQINYQILPPYGEGWTALHVAIMRNRLDTVETLLEQGANPSVTTTAGLNAFDFAKKYYRDEIAELIKKYMR